VTNIGQTPMQLGPGAVAMVLIATLTAALVTNSGRSAWFPSVLLLMVYLIFSMMLYLLPPGCSEIALRAWRVCGRLAPTARSLLVRSE
jgi:hypothetical protein